MLKVTSLVTKVNAKVNLFDSWIRIYAVFLAWTKIKIIFLLTHGMTVQEHQWCARQSSFGLRPCRPNEQNRCLDRPAGRTYAIPADGLLLASFGLRKHPKTTKKEHEVFGWWIIKKLKKCVAFMKQTFIKCCMKN